MQHNVLFLVPARGGSKGFPRKNLALLAGIPLVGRTARTARQAGMQLDTTYRVVCSTDDDAIAGAARKWGAEVPFMRPPQLATDEAGSMEVVLHALDSLPDDFDTVVLLQATSPLTDAQDVVDAVRLHWETGRSVVSVCAETHPPEWLCHLGENGLLAPVFAVSAPQRRQDSTGAFRPNGAIYVASPTAMRRNGAFMTESTGGYLMPGERSVDVDSAQDLCVAERSIYARGVPSVTVADRQIGPGKPCFVIAEAGVNHNGSLDLAMRLVDAAVQTCADAVKFQTFRAEKLATAGAPKADYQLKTTAGDESQFAMLKRLELDDRAHRSLVEHCGRVGILFLSTAFDEDSCDYLDSLGVPAFKLPSGELTNLPFLRHVARKRKPIIMSTGMGHLTEVADAVDTVRMGGNNELILLHCVSSYPTDPKDANLRAMATLRDAFGVPVGFSDHTEGDTTAVTAVALGACVIEKHLTLDKRLAGPDQHVSMEPTAMANLVARIRTAEAALGDGTKRPTEGELHLAGVARRSLVASCLIPEGTVLERHMVTLLRPGTGLPPSLLNSIVGTKATRTIEPGTLLETEMFS